MLELHVSHLRMPVHDALPGVAFLRPRGWPDMRAIAVPISAADALTLIAEVRRVPRCGGPRSFIRWVAGGLARDLIIRLVPAARLGERAMEPLGTTVEVPMEPGAALAAAVRFGLPLLGDPRLFSDQEWLETPSVAAFMEGHQLERCG
jgi:hypothetical protein